MLRDAVPLEECGRALVVKLRHHGDVLLAAPVLATLKSHAPKLVAPAMPGRGRFWAKSFTHLYPVVGGGRRHQVELNLDALRRVGIQPSLAERKVVFVPGRQAEAKVSQLVPESFIHMHPASRWSF